MGQKCRACGRYVNMNDSTKCTKCAALFHKACVNIPKDAKVPSTWQCPECKVLTPRKDNTEVPVLGETIPMTSEAMCAEILREVRQHREETKTMQADLDALRTLVGGFGSRLDEVESRLADLEINCSKSQEIAQMHGGGVEVESLRSTVDQLKFELNERDQEAFSNDVEISGVPEEQGECTGHLLAAITAKLGVACDERDVVFVERSGVRRAPSSGVGAKQQDSSAAAVRPRPIVLRVARRQLRDALLQAARVRRSLTTEGMGLAAAPGRFYVNERLSRYNKMLFFKTREMARSHGWKYVWTRGGRIFVRREAGKASFRVRLEQDLEKVFGRQGS